MKASQFYLLLALPFLCLCTKTPTATVTATATSPDLPTQIHVNQGDATGTAITISWTTTYVQDSRVFLRSGRVLVSVPSPTVKVLQYTFTSKFHPFYVSGFIHHYTISGLSYSTTYEYMCGAYSGGFSRWYRFTTPPPPGPSSRVVFGIFGDPAWTSETSTNVKDVIADTTIQAFLMLGDLSYADSHKNSSADTPRGQDQWDLWQQRMQPLMATIPTMTLPGDRDIEPDSATKDEFVAYQARFRMPGTERLWYSFNYGPVHIVMLSSFSNIAAGSDQYNFLLADLISVDRSVTPWVMVNFHAPYYTSNTQKYNDPNAQKMKQSIESLLLRHRVDLVFSSHANNYERTYHTYKDVVDMKGPTYLTVGTGGVAVATSWKSQPVWSAFRLEGITAKKSILGHGRLEIVNGTHALWQWQSLSSAAIRLSDQTWLVRAAGVGTVTPTLTPTASTSRTLTNTLTLSDAPTQIHINQGDTNGRAITISWMTWNTTDSVVYIRLASDKSAVNCSSTIVVLQYNFSSAFHPFYVSGFIHHYTAKNLRYATTYEYMCGSPLGGFSLWYRFTTPPQPQPTARVVFGIFGDPAWTAGTSVNVQDVIADTTIQAFLMLGDLSYADSHKDSTSSTPRGQQEWDHWFMRMQPLMSTIPTMTLPGDREIEPDSVTNQEFVAYKNRLRMPGSDRLYYSFNYGPVHVVMLSSFTSISVGSRQYNFLVADLQAVNRSITPWLMVNFHAPYYTSNTQKYNEATPNKMKQSIESLMAQYNVDMVFSSHANNYERTYHTYQDNINMTGPIYMTVGTGGVAVATSWHTKPVYCAYRLDNTKARDSILGHGRLEIVNTTHALWRWQSLSTAAVRYTDEVWLQRTL